MPRTTPTPAAPAAGVDLDAWDDAPATVRVNGVDIPTADLRLVINDTVVVCEAHELAAEDAELRRVGHTRTVPRVGGDCAYCTAGTPPQRHRRDAAGNPVCGHDVLAGTPCTRPPGHDGGHGAGCQACGGDWLDGTCTCPDH